jgi:NAD(P)-dependent dehydrogenase (short-subunit alcohol dehydrogenase family)
MDIRGKTALVTGANRGLGQAFAEALLEAGAAKVYAGARDPSTVRDPRLTPVRLDVTNPREVSAAAAACDDVEILINNAGAMFGATVLDADSEDALRREMEVNVFGLLAMAKAFAPVMAANGGGALVNMLSVVSWYVYPFNSTYGATKHAALAITDGLRIQLRAQGTLVIAVHAGLIDTDMGAALSSGPKTSPGQVASRTIEAIQGGLEHVAADDSAAGLWRASRQDLVKRHADMQALWDQHLVSAGANEGA